MATVIRHASANKPISVPCNGIVAPDNWDRVQTFSPATSQPTELLYEIGRLAKMVTYKDTFESTLSISQLEYGKVDAYLQLANLSAEPVGGVALADFSTAKTDFYLPGKDEYGGTLEQTLWLQKMTVDSFSVELSAEERITRSFDLSGNFAKICRYGNKYLIFNSDVVGSGEASDYEITLDDPAPVEDPNNAGIYILQVFRVTAAGVATELIEDTDFTWTNGSTLLTVATVTFGDNIRIWYTAAGYGGGGDPAELNDVDDYYLKADNVLVTIDDGSNPPITLDKLTSLSVSATLNRLDQGVIGNDEKILNEVETYEVSVSLGGFVKGSTILEALMTQAGQSWGIIDYTLFSSVDVIVKIYDESTKDTFAIGYKASALEFSDSSEDYNANEYSEETVTLVGDALIISEDIGNM